MAGLLLDFIEEGLGYPGNCLLVITSDLGSDGQVIDSAPLMAANAAIGLDQEQLFVRKWPRHSGLLRGLGARLARSHGEKRTTSHATKRGLLNNFAVIGFAGPLGSRESTCGLPLSDGLTADAELFGKCAKPNSFNGLSDWVRVHASQSN